MAEGSGPFHTPPRFEGPSNDRAPDADGSGEQDIERLHPVVEDSEPVVSLSDPETVLVIDRRGDERQVPRFGPWRDSPTGKRFRHRVIVDECLHDGRTESSKVQRPGYGTSFCPLCTASRGVDGLWRVLEDGPKQVPQAKARSQVGEASVLCSCGHPAIRHYMRTGTCFRCEPCVGFSAVG